MLQEAVDALFDNGRRGRVLRGANNRRSNRFPTRSRASRAASARTLLGKRVDYSAAP